MRHDSGMLHPLFGNSESEATPPFGRDNEAKSVHGRGKQNHCFWRMESRSNLYVVNTGGKRVKINVVQRAIALAGCVDVGILICGKTIPYGTDHSLSNNQNVHHLQQMTVLLLWGRVLSG